MAQPRFYASMKPLGSFANFSTLSKYKSVPDGWYVIITDIKNSTKAIKEGRYKEVNTVGASSITAVLNAVKNVDIPYVFGGDGATMLVPAEVLPQTKSALLATQMLAKDGFGLHLRVGIVPIEDIRAQGVDVTVAKFMETRHYTQALFAGEGLTLAEHLVKEHTKKYELLMDVQSKADFSGLSCRWQDIKSAHGETVSLIVKAIGAPSQDVSTYEKVFKIINNVYGTEEQFHPIVEDQLQLAVPSANVNAVLNRKSAVGRFLFRAFWTAVLSISSLVMKTPITFADFNFRKYKRLMIATADYKKFDGALRLVMIGTAKQREQLTKALDALRKQRKIAYGLHVSDRALMTCLVFELYGKQVHFIDGADGGYAHAATALKAQLKSA